MDGNDLVHFRDVDADAPTLQLQVQITNSAATQCKDRYVRPNSDLQGSFRRNRG